MKNKHTYNNTTWQSNDKLYCLKSISMYNIGEIYEIKHIEPFDKIYGIRIKSSKNVSSLFSDRPYENIPYIKDYFLNEKDLRIKKLESL